MGHKLKNVRKEGRKEDEATKTTKRVKERANTIARWTGNFIWPGDNCVASCMALLRPRSQPTNGGWPFLFFFFSILSDSSFSSSSSSSSSCFFWPTRISSLFRSLSSRVGTWRTRGRKKNRNREDQRGRHPVTFISFRFGYCSCGGSSS